MRYRAVLVTPEQLARPVQTFHPDYFTAEDWAREILTGCSKQTTVEIYEQREDLCGVVKILGIDGRESTEIRAPRELQLPYTKRERVVRTVDHYESTQPKFPAA